ncbi:hypothetical protein [Nitrosopumilus sp.]|uniref:hypothetical protein n=1 Tax=Nitrosopumilus sp. TaxID=2024843 RepID=UPI0034A04CFC
MNPWFVFFTSLLLIPSVFVTSFATITDFTTDKTLYHTDDSIVLSGNVVYSPDLFSIIVQIVTPSGNGMAHVDSIIPKNDGTFTKIINVGGPTWSENGQYKIKVSYGGNLEKFISYEKTSDYIPPNSQQSSTPINNVPKSNIPINDTPQNNVIDSSFTENPKMLISGFPSLDQSPQYYIDRYNNEPEFKSWFDLQFSLYSIDEVVGYPPTIIQNYFSLDKSPQYYIDRYNNEPEYKSWFDSQLPGKTIYFALGFFTYVPDWIKTYAQNWAMGEITDEEFIYGLNFMLQNKIIVLSDLDDSSPMVDDLPSWFRNTAFWWSNDLISQQEFINSIKYLIQEDIIIIE